MSDSDSKYSDLPVEYRMMMRLLEDDVTPQNVEQHIADFREKLADLFSPESLSATEPYREKFLESVRRFSGYEPGRIANG